MISDKFSVNFAEFDFENKNHPGSCSNYVINYNGRIFQSVAKNENGKGVPKLKGANCLRSAKIKGV